MAKLVEVSEQEVHIDFKLNCKCRANVSLKSLSPTLPIAFKVQTSSPHKFLVNPPNGLIPPLSHATFQIILKPQSHLPPSFPRSPTDRFLIKTAHFPSDDDDDETTPDTINSWFNSESLATYDLKLKLAYVGQFLLRHAISMGDFDAVKNIVKRQKSLLSPADSDSLTRLLTESSTNSDKIINILSEAAGFRVNAARAAAELDNGEQYVTTELHVAVADNRTDEVSRLITEACERGVPLDYTRDKDGRTALHVGADKGNVGCVKMLIEGGADINAKCNDGRTALYTAAANGDYQMVGLLVEMGADPMVSVGRSAIDVARDKGHTEVVKLLEQGDLVLTTARRGEANNLQQLLRRGANANHKDQYGLTALHVAAIKGHRDALSVLVGYGVDVERGDNEGHTALHLAVEGGDVETVQLLVNRGANVDAMSKNGATPLYLASAMGYDEISEFLLSRGASLPSSSTQPSLM